MTWTSAAPDGRADALITSFERAGYVRVTPAILQPAEPFLDLSGEDIRKRMYLTTDPHGRELCLRPGPHHPGLARLSGLACRRRAAGVLLSRSGVPPSRRGRRPNSCRPASNPSAAPTRRRRMPKCSRSGSRPRRNTAWAPPDIRMGDVALFSALIAALDLAPAWKRRLIKDFNHKTSLVQDLDRLAISAVARAAGIPGRARRARRLRSRRPPMRWSPTCSRSPASPPSADARWARSPTAFSSSRRSAPRPRCRGRPAR